MDSITDWRELAAIPWTRAALEELGRRLPADDAVLEAWLEEVVALREEWVFRKVVFAALGAGRSLQAKHLVEGAALFEESEQLRLSAARFAGDVGAALVAAVDAERMDGEREAVALAVAAMWCRERREGCWTPGLLAAARRLGRMGRSSPLVTLGLAIVCAATRDPGLKSILEGVSLPWVAGEESQFWKEAEGDLWNCVPHEAAPHVLTGYTVRRAVARVGRNEPCPCGSGKKYKHCCLSKDQERLRQSSAVPGLTLREWREQPELGLTWRRLRDMSSYEVVRLDPSKVPHELVEHLLDRLLSFNEVAAAVRCLEQTGAEKEGDWFYWQWTLSEVVRLGDRALVDRLMALRPAVDVSQLGVGARLLLTEGTGQQQLAVMEEEALRTLRMEDSMLALVEFAYDLLAGHTPALGVLVARGVVPLASPLDGDSLLLRLLEVRDNLELSIEEPIEEVLHTLMETSEYDRGEDSAELELARRTLALKADEVRQLKAELAGLQQDLRRREDRAARPEVATPTAAPPLDDADGVSEKEMTELRAKVRGLRERLKERHAERNELRRELVTARQQLAEAQEERASPPPAVVAQPDGEPLFDLVENLGQQPLRWPEWPNKFREELARFPRQVAKSVLVLVARLASGEPGAFVGIKRLRSAPDVYRQRVAAHYRLLFRMHSETLQVIDLVDRKDLERVVKERL